MKFLIITTYGNKIIEAEDFESAANAYDSLCLLGIILINDETGF